MATKAPTGLTIKRNGNTFTFGWKLGQKYNKKQQFAQYNGSWGKVIDIGKSVTSRSLTISLASYYPNTNKYLKAIQFKVRGLQNKTWSPYSSKKITLSVPKAPSVSVAKDENLDTTVKFTWSVVTDNTDLNLFTDVEYQSVLIDGCNETNGAKVASYFNSKQKGWITGKGGANDSKTITEVSGNVANGSHTRWIRVRSRGVAGASAWRYARFVYAKPGAAEITNAKAVKLTAAGYQVSVEWTAASSAAYPIDKVAVEYLEAVPGADLSVPGGANWTEARTLAQNGSKNAVSFLVDQNLDEDEVMFVRVRAYHSSQAEPTDSTPVIAEYGKLKKPEITNVVTNDSTFRATITATKNSEVPDAFIVIVYRTSDAPDQINAVGVIASGSTYTAQLADWTEKTKQFGVYNAVGTYSQVTREDGTTSFEVDSDMTSDINWEGGAVPEAPGEVSVSATATPGTVRITWDWPWEEADSSTISWADHEDAWRSTDQPSDYTISNTNANEWYITGLETGKRWYFRVRLNAGSGDNAVHGAWSEAVTIDLSSAPVIPTLSLSDGLIPQDGSVAAFWSYVSTDGTAQAYAEICEATIDGDGIEYGDIIASTQSAQHVTIYAEEAGWSEGETHYLCVRVTSASGKVSDEWSAPVPVIIAAPLEIEISETSLEKNDETGEYTLTKMPLTATITGAGNGGTTTLIIERAQEYHVDRPDEETFNGYEGETIALWTQTGEAEITIDRDMLTGSLDDGALYNVIATIQDGLGQSASETIPFEVSWNHQAVMPEAEVEIYEGVAVITPVKPDGYEEGDTVDIYRLSADKPELIIQGAAFDVAYVDPYPAFNEFGGHRVVYRTIDGDYITADNELAWIDLQEEQGDYIKSIRSVIDFDGNEIELLYDTTHSTSWEKDFKETRYLGGSIQGDWNKGIGVSSSIKSAMVTIKDQEAIKAMRRLAAHPGICHLRTVDGASYACDIEITNDRQYDQETIRSTFNLDITKVDTQELDGMTLEEWQSED